MVETKEVIVCKNSIMYEFHITKITFTTINSQRMQCNVNGGYIIKPTHIEQ